MSNEKLYTKCPHCGADVHVPDDGYCFVCGSDMTREPVTPTVFPACPEPFTHPTPNVMTPDGRREVAIKMLEDLVELRLKMIRVGGSVLGGGNKLEKVTELTAEYQTLQEQILELMGVDS